MSIYISSIRESSSKCVVATGNNFEGQSYGKLSELFENEAVAWENNSDLQKVDFESHIFL